MRPLSPEETELWARVAATIRPLSRAKHAHEASEKQQESPARAKSAREVSGSRATAPVAAVPIAKRTLDGSWDKRLRSGEVELDRVLDVHGMSLDRAWAAIDRTLEQAIGNGERVVLLVTGHHRPGEPPVERGRIRAAVHDWLAVSRHAPSIASVRGAHRRHGGGGSLYLILKRKIRAR